jgi:hypothetical protein
MPQSDVPHASCLSTFLHVRLNMIWQFAPMCSLACNCVRSQALDLAKKGLRADLMSQVCWHVFGLLHKS